MSSNPSFALRNEITGLYFSKTGIASAFSEENPVLATLVSEEEIKRISLIWEMSKVQKIVGPIKIIIESSPGYYVHANGKRQTGSDFARSYFTLVGAKKALGKFRRVWKEAKIAFMDGNFTPIK